MILSDRMREYMAAHGYSMGMEAGDMAVVAEIRASNGVLVRIHDDCMAAPGSEEEARRIEDQRRIAYDILTKCAARTSAEGEQ